MRYSLRTLLILLAVGPPALAWAWFADLLIPIGLIIGVVLLVAAIGVIVLVTLVALGWAAGSIGDRLDKTRLGP